MIEGKLKVFCVGSDWFMREMGSQKIDVSKVEWTPPPETPEDVAKRILAHRIGDTITFLIQRGKDRQTIQVTAGTIPAGAF